jgi:DNA repair protein RadA/Sms
MAIYSSFKNIALDSKSLVFGEIGLAGEIRPVQRGQERLREAAKLGFHRAVIPAANKPKQRIDGMEIVAVERINEALDHLRG